MKYIIVLIPLLIFYSCSGSKPVQYPEPSNTATAGSFNYKKGEYQFGEKTYNADYGTISVPENRSNSQSRLIHLPVIRIHASLENIEPIFVLSGGPGMSNMGFRPIDSLLYNHDFVIVGYRGVDGSTVLDCPEVSEAYENGEDDLLNKQSLRIIGEAWTKCFDRFKSSGVDLNGYTIPETVEDIEAVRKAFNYDRINLISESYGTRIAYIYGLIHPEVIRRSIMIACNPPGRFFYDPEITDEKIKYYSKLWSKDSSMIEKSPNLELTMRKVLKDMPSHWGFFSINPGKVKVITFALLFQRATAAMVFDSYVAAEKGDYSGLALMSMAFDYVFPDMSVWGDAATKAVSVDYDSLKILSTVNSQDEILGAPMNKLVWEPLRYSTFPIKMIPDSLRHPAYSDVETLILSGNVDFSTPAEYGKEFLTYLRNGRQVVISEAGHVGDIRYFQLDAVKGLMSNYINKGIVDTSKIKYVPMDFKVSWGFPTIAKTALGLIGIVILLLVASIIWII